MAFRRFRRFRRRRRTVSWVPGITFDPQTVIDPTIEEPEPQVASFLAALTANSDFASVGGEDAVVTRIVGQLHFINLTLNRESVPIGRFPVYAEVRAAIFKGSEAQDGTVVVPSLYRSADLGYDNILWTGEAIVPAIAVNTLGFNDFVINGVSGGGADQGVGGDWYPASQNNRMSIDVAAKRRIQSDDHIHLTIQWKTLVSPYFTVPDPEMEARLFGFLRVLLMRPV